MSELWLIHSKLKPPRFRAPLLTREALFDRLEEARRHTLTIMQAGAGEGKSTTLALFVTQSTLPFAWYTLGPEDADPLVFWSHLAAALDSVHPGIQATLHPLLVRARQGEFPWGLIAEALVNAAEQTPTDCLLVLDDIHHLDDHPETVRTFERWVGLLPPTLHLIITTRRRLTWPTLTRFLAQRRAWLITESELRLTSADIAALFAHHGIRLRPDQCEQLYNATEGWIMPLQLLAAHLRGATAERVDEALPNLAASLDMLGDFLMHTLIAPLPASLQQFLFDTAILRVLEPAACDAVRRRRDSAALLAQLADIGLNLVQIDDQTYRHHHLVHEFLQQEAQRDPVRWRLLHRRAAAYFAQHGQAEESIDHLLQAEDYEAAAHGMSIVAPRLLAEGRFAHLRRWLNALPDAIRDAWPDLLLIQGDVARFTSRYDDALAAYRRAETCYLARDDAIGQSQALKSQALVYIDTVHPAPAEQLLKQALRVLRREAPTESADLLQLLAENATNRGRPNLGARWYAAARRLGAPPNTELEARIHLRSGRLDACRTILTDQHAAPPHRPARTHREPSLLLAFVDVLQGRTTSARQRAADGLALARRLQSPFTESVAHMRLGHAWQLPPLADIARAQRHYEHAIRLNRELAILRGEAEPLFGLAFLHAHHGAPATALEAADRAIRLALRAGDEWVAAIGHLARGITHALHTTPEDAASALHEALHRFETCHDMFGAAMAHLWLAWTAYHTHDPDTFAEHAPRWLAYAITAPEHLHAATLFGLRDPQAYIPLLIHARDHLPPPAAERARVLLRQTGLPADIAHHPGYTLHVRLFGPFEVCRGKQPVPADAWRRAKARHFLGLLALHPTPLQREVLFEHLWPDTPPDNAETQLKVTLNALANAIEPERPRRAGTFFIHREGNTIAIQRDAVVCDVWLFQDLIARAEAEPEAERAIELLEQALALYRGDVLPECRYEEWAWLHIERLRLQAVRAAEWLARLYLTRGDAEAAIASAERALALDTCWEPAYRIAMRACAMLHRRPHIVRLYRRCREALQRELGVAPMPETTALYEALVGYAHDANRGGVDTP